MPANNNERHRTSRIGWLRAAVLGANDGILSTSSLVLGVAAAHATHGSVVVAGVAGLVAGAMSMAAGEYVSVHSQADTEKADLKLERAELKTDDKGEHKELAAIYVARGLDPALAKQVAQQLMAHDAIGAHARDELGISEAVPCASDSGRVGIGLQLRRWGSHASFGRHYSLASQGYTDCRRKFVDVPGASRWLGGTRGWGRSDSWRLARHILGSSRDGGDRGSRVAIRNSCVSGA